MFDFQFFRKTSKNTIETKVHFRIGRVFALFLISVVMGYMNPEFLPYRVQGDPHGLIYITTSAEMKAESATTPLRSYVPQAAPHFAGTAI